MKEMIYTKERKREWLLHDYYREIEFVIMSLGTHPTAYIGVEKDNPYWLSSGDSLESCNGGITYANSFIYDEEKKKYENNKWWLGWDYSHMWDYTTLFNETFGLKKWTTEEILEEVKATIDEVLGEDNERS